MDKIDKIKELFTKLGLTHPETIVYLHLLERGTSLSISDIAKDIGTFRPIVYKALGLLLERKLITITIKGKRKQYIAEHPEKIRGLLREMSIDIEETLPDLEDLYRAPKDKPIIKFLEGRNGISSVYSDIVDSLKKGDAFYRYSSSKDRARTNKYLPKDYREKRDNKNLERYVIRSKATEADVEPDFNQKTKVIPSEFDLFDQNIIQLIYGHKVAVVDLNTETSFVIENEKFADFQKKIFKLLYGKL
ncbi:MAG TPA: helix-turn-helix domain-containing protein [Candidatus Paceibacterota bacterium]